MKVLQHSCAFAFCSSFHSKHPMRTNRVNKMSHIDLGMRETSNSSAFASLTASALIALTSSGVKEVPPPRGKSTSAVNSEEVLTGLGMSVR